MNFKTAVILCGGKGTKYLHPSLIKKSTIGLKTI
jgi:hypothetical protein